MRREDADLTRATAHTRMTCSHGHGCAKSAGRSGWLDADLLSALACGALLLAGVLAPRLGANDTVARVLLWASCAAGGWRVAIRSLQQLLRLKLDVDLLMLVAAIGAGIINQWTEGAVLLFLFALSHGLENLASERARHAIRALGTLTPTTARVIRGGEESDIAVDALRVGDLVRIKPAERVAVDGELLDGETTVDQSPITGESVPVHKSPGSLVFAGTLNGDGVITVRTTKLASETTMARMIRLVEESQSAKGTVQRMTERFTAVYTPIVLGGVPVLIAVMVLAFRMDFADAFLRAMAVLVGASPCALAISTPSAMLAGIAQAARSGVLIKGGMHLESLGTIRAIAFDKTGTITRGRPEVQQVIGLGTASEQEVIAVAASLNRNSSHPLALAISRRAARDAAGDATGDGRAATAVASHEVDGVRALPGRGIEGFADGTRIAVVGPRALGRDGLPTASTALLRQIADLESAAHTVSVVTRAAEVIGVIAMSDQVRPDVREILARLKALGISRLVLLTGDNRTVAARVAEPLGVDEIRAELLPEDKIAEVRRLLGEWQSVAMVGDGVNDAPALAMATVGVAMGASGTDVALEAADIALMADDLSKLPFAVGLSRRARSIVRQNVAISMAVVAMLIPFAAVGVVPLSAAVVLHEGSTVVVAFNALRLLRYRERSI
ncbi:MAG: heavy metal translocating P-type ATPase [Planctomycetes bacterium]|nr:heavy metal translocating P-type ATPase [Planctomycetota bacterium]